MTRTTPLLSHDEEIALGRRIAQGDQSARHELAERNIGLVKKVCRQYFTTDPATTFDDLIQIGCAALMVAVDRYNPDAGTRFSTYAMYWIRQAVQRAAVTSGTIKKATYPNRVQVTERGRRDHALRQAAITRLDAPLASEDDLTLLDLLADDAPPVEAQVLANITTQRILSRLSARDAMIFAAYMDGATLEEAGEAAGVCRERARQIIVAARRRFAYEVLP